MNTNRERHYITAAIPYVNARPHLGHALELVEADALARHHRRHGADVRLLNGTDDNAFKNVLAAASAGEPVAEFVERNSAAFRELAAPLDLSFDDFIATGSDPRHRPGVEALWEACTSSGDFYQRSYEGLYCTGCEQFYTPSDLADGVCAEHGSTPELVAETNWFFRLSRYAPALRELITTGALRIEPAQRRNEALAAIDAGLEDISVSRDARRSHGWGIPVPGDPSQVIYVWWDALCNYVSALDVARSSTQSSGGDFDRWWSGADSRTHVIGKGILRFHALYWPALLLSAGHALPTTIFVHDYLTADGAKIAKSAGNTVDPADIVADVGTDALRWWLLAEVPRVGDADYSRGRLVERWDAAFPNGVGNLAGRVTRLLRLHRPSGLTATPATWAATSGLDQAAGALADEVASCIARFDLRAGATAIERVVTEGNRLVAATEPWKLAKDPSELAQDQFDAVCSAVLAALCAVADELAAYTPQSAAALRQRLADLGAEGPLYRRLAA